MNPMNQSLKMMILFSRDQKEETTEKSFDPEVWVSEMKNADDTSGGHWNRNQTESVRKQIGSGCDPESFWTAMNMMYSDYSEVLKTYGIDRPEVYGSLANAFLCDKDSKKGSEKLSAYWSNVVK